MRIYRRGNKKPILGEKDNCYKCGNEIFITDTMIKHRLFWCPDCKKKHINKYPNQKKARQKVKDAIKYGKIIKGKCEKCGDIKTSAHHKDYSKPLDIIWLCHSCHMKEHKNIRTGNKNTHRPGTLIFNVSKMNIGDVCYSESTKNVVISCFYILRKKFNEMGKKFKAKEVGGVVEIIRIK